MTGPERGMHLDPGQVPTTLKAPATEPGQPPAGERWGWQDRDGIRVEVSDPGRGGGLAALRVYGSCAWITPAAALDLARAVHQVCGLSEPILLERTPNDAGDGWTVRRGPAGGVLVRAASEVTPEQARVMAAALAVYADRVDAEANQPDPAELTPPAVSAAELRRMAAQVAALCPEPGTVHVGDHCDYVHAAAVLTARAAALEQEAADGP